MPTLQSVGVHIGHAQLERGNSKPKSHQHEGADGSQVQHFIEQRALRLFCL
ncbi:hypothetical protein [Agarivorans aestuarii]|uniref:hypothetical protein n=1 Tax=Agarivorans aestuarii TaxID=1563703 RepID=UPI001C7F51BF|nr:hypothetical protein [Agarivorans aestuarii]